MLIKPQESLLVVIDPQESLLRVVREAERVVHNISLLVEAARTFSVPIIATTQYREKLGDYPSEIKARLQDIPLYNKLEFSVFRNETIKAAIAEKKRKNLILCGVETHICVYQSALSAQQEGYRAIVIIDATSSRSEHNFHWGATRLRDLGIIVLSTEMLIYEWLERAGTPEFKALLPLLKGGADRN